MSFNTVIKGFKKAGVFITQGFAQPRITGLATRICRVFTDNEINMTISTIRINGICKLFTSNEINMRVTTQ